MAMQPTSHQSRYSSLVTEVSRSTQSIPMRKGEYEAEAGVTSKCEILKPHIKKEIMCQNLHAHRCLVSWA